jgi:hypothetical protein
LVAQFAGKPLRHFSDCAPGALHPAGDVGIARRKDKARAAPGRRRRAENAGFGRGYGGKLGQGPKQVPHALDQRQAHDQAVGCVDQAADFGAMGFRGARPAAVTEAIGVPRLAAARGHSNLIFR